MYLRWGCTQWQWVAKLFFFKSMSQSRDTVKCFLFRPVLRQCSSVLKSVSFFSHNWSCLVKDRAPPKEWLASLRKEFFISNKKSKNYHIWKFLDFLFEIKKSFLCESPLQILLTNSYLDLKGFYLSKVPKWKIDLGLFFRSLYPCVVLRWVLKLRTRLINKQTTTDGYETILAKPEKIGESVWVWIL